MIGLAVSAVACQGSSSGPSSAEIAAAAAGDPGVQGVLSMLAGQGCVPSLTGSATGEASGDATGGFVLSIVHACPAQASAPARVGGLAVSLDPNLVVTSASAMQLTAGDATGRIPYGFVAFREEAEGPIVQETFLEWMTQLRGLVATAGVALPVADVASTPCRVCQATLLTSVTQIELLYVPHEASTACHADLLTILNDRLSPYCDEGILSAEACAQLYTWAFMPCKVTSKEAVASNPTTVITNMEANLTQYDIQDECAAEGQCSASAFCRDSATDCATPCVDPTPTDGVDDCAGSVRYSECARDDEGVFYCCQNADAFHQNGTNCCLGCT